MNEAITAITLSPAWQLAVGPLQTLVLVLLISWCRSMERTQNDLRTLLAVLQSRVDTLARNGSPLLPSQHREASRHAAGDLM